MTNPKEALGYYTRKENENRTFLQRMKDRVISISQKKMCPVRNDLCTASCVCWELGASITDDKNHIWVKCRHKLIEDVVYEESVTFVGKDSDDE